MMNSHDSREPCPGCSSFLLEPYIRCTQCGPPHVEICLHCFAKGFEFGAHQNNHGYIVIVSTNIAQTNPCNNVHVCVRFQLLKFLNCLGLLPVHVLCMADVHYFPLQRFSTIVQFLLQKNDFPVFEPNWTAAEEIQLLDALSDCGIGNWSV